MITREHTSTVGSKYWLVILGKYVLASMVDYKSVQENTMYAVWIVPYISA
jgi:hypothetical protein